MSYTPEQSAIRPNDQMAQEIQKAASSQEVSAILKRYALQQHLVTEDAFDQNILHAIPAGDPARVQRWARVVTVNGQKITLESDVSEDDLTRQEVDLWRAAEQQQAQPRGNDGRFVELPPLPSEADRVAGDLVEQSLAARGVNLADLQEFTAQKFTQSWADATTEFKNGLGSDWIGGSENLATVARLLAENNLMDQPSAETLNAVWQHMKQNGLVAENPEATMIDAIRQSNDPFALRALLQSDRDRSR